MNGQQNRIAQCGFGVGPLLKQDYPIIKDYVRIFNANKQTIWYEDKMFAEQTVAYTDSSLLDVLNYDLIEGDKNALQHPNAIIISEPMAIKYFGSAKGAIGKELKFTTFSVSVLGVFRKPHHTHLPYNFFISVATLPKTFAEERNKDYMWMTGGLYIKLTNEATESDLKNALEIFCQKVIDPFTKANDIGRMRYEVQPIKSIHLDNSLSFDLPQANPTYIKIFKVVGFFILLIACVNYMNLTTARSSRRTTEVGIRKVVGASRSQLTYQFMLESFLMMAASFLFSMALIKASLTAFNEITSQELTMKDFLQVEFLSKVAVVILSMALLSSIYPSLYLSGFKPVDILKMKKSSHLTGQSLLQKLISPTSLRKVLVLLQFSISIMLVIGTLVVSDQLTFLKMKDIGFNKDQLFAIDIPNDTTVSNRLEVVKNELNKIPNVKSVATGSSLPGTNFGALTFNTDQGSGNVIKIIKFAFVDEDYVGTLGVKMKEGRNFSKDISSDATESFIVNEAAIKMLDVKNALDAKLESGLGQKGHVIGVVKNFNFVSLHNPLEPLVFMFTKKTQGFLIIKLETSDVARTIKSIERAWKEFDPNHPFESFFLDDNFNTSYQKEGRLLRIFIFFSMLSIFICCLGLLGLSLFASEMRVREIGIRKVLGATTTNISALLLKDFLILVILANVVAWPVAYYYLSDWLKSFAYQLELGIIPFIAGSCLAILIAIGTMTYTIMKSVSGSMVKALKYE